MKAWGNSGSNADAISAKAATTVPTKSMPSRQGIHTSPDMWRSGIICVCIQRCVGSMLP